MQLGMIGLGRMGANMVRRLIKSGHSCVVFDRSPKAVDELVRDHAIGADSLIDLVKQTGEAASGLADGSGGGRGQDHRRLCRIWRQATSSSTAEIPITSTISGAPKTSRPNGSTTWTWAPAAACGVWSAATA